MSKIELENIDQLPIELVNLYLDIHKDDRKLLGVDRVSEDLSEGVSLSIDPQGKVVGVKYINGSCQYKYPFLFLLNAKYNRRSDYGNITDCMQRVVDFMCENIHNFSVKNAILDSITVKNMPRRMTGQKTKNNVVLFSSDLTLEYIAW